MLELPIQPDHVHRFVRVWPTTPAAVVGACEGRTSRDLRERFSWLTRLPSLSTRAYLASTAGSVSGETIRRYIEAQKGV
ncbi:MAG: transposase [Chloroflexota bacterium]|nr:transposase [Chloroflexota bacterium]